jgi:hypothetical protein
VSGGVQLPLEGLPLDPVEVSGLQAPDRGRLYQQIGLDFEQIQAIEDAVRAVLAGQYARSYGVRRAP